MNILCTNDDGYLAAGLRLLAAAARSLGTVTVVAPDREQSATSHSLTLHHPLRARRGADGGWVVDGTPTDCVILAVNELLEERADVCVSGVNHGPNMGEDVFYSGTVAAAVEGALRGAAGIACSLAPRAKHVDHAIGFAAEVVRAAIEEPIPAGTVLNVNMPGSGSDQYQWTTLGRRLYEDDVAEREDPRGRPYYWVGGGPAGHDDVEGSDCVAVARGWNSITPMHLDITDRGRVAQPPWSVAGFHVVVGPDATPG